MPDQERWVVYDDEGVIATGSEEEMRQEFADPSVEWSGDLTLARIVEVRR